VSTVLAGAIGSTQRGSITRSTDSFDGICATALGR
jgi:hypothetical protein